MNGVKDKNFTNLVYRTSKDVPIEAIQELYRSINWKEKDFETISDYLERSIVVVSTWDEDKLIGIARATESCSGEVIIWDVAVKPTYQRKGIGSKIMKCLLTILDDYAVPVVTLYADPGKEKFYEKFGFTHHESKMLAMIRKK